MPPPGRVQRPAVKRPVVQTGAGNTTSTDTWNTTKSSLHIAPPSTKSTVPGVSLKKPAGSNGSIRPPPPKRTSGVSSSVKPFPGAKLRPLQANNRDSSQNYSNTWDPKNRPINSHKPIVSVKATKAKLNSTGPNTPNVNNARAAETTPSSRSSSVTSAKQVLPGIRKTASRNVSPEKTAGKLHVTMEAKPEKEERPKSSVVDGRALTARKRDVASAKLRNATAQETKETDKFADYFIPEWYKNPLIKPEKLKGGITVFCSGGLSEETLGQMDFINWQAVVGMLPLKDLKKYMREYLDRSLVTLAYFPPDDPGAALEGAILPVVSKSLAEKANKAVGRECYVPSLHDPELYHLFPPYFKDGSLTSDVPAIISDAFNYNEYCTEVADSVGIKSVSTIEELENAIVKAQKRRVNVVKQERALHPHVYLESFESEDVWNHVNMCHAIPEHCYRREDLLKKVKTAIMADAGRVSSPMIISGNMKSGKTWLCAQIPSLMGAEFVTLVRFCGLTRLTSTLSKLLRGLSKQLHILYHSPILPRNLEQFNLTDVFERFKDILSEVAVSAEKPVVLVLDSFDKLDASCNDLGQFLSLCKDSVPANVVLIYSFTKDSDETEFFDPRRDAVVERLDDLEATLVGKIQDVDYEFEMESWCSEAAATALGLDREVIVDLNKQIDVTVETLSETTTLEACRSAAKQYHDLHNKIDEHILSAVNPDALLDPLPEGLEREEIRADLKHVKEARATARKQRAEFVKVLEACLRRLEEAHPTNKEYFASLCHTLDSCTSDKTQQHIHVTDFSSEEAGSYIKHLATGRVAEGDIKKLQELAGNIHNPLLLHLTVNTCAAFLPVDTVVSAFTETFKEENKQFLEDLYITMTREPTYKTVDTRQPHGLVHMVLCLLVYGDIATLLKPDFTIMQGLDEIARHDFERENFAGYRLTEGASFFLQHENVEYPAFMYAKQVMNGCQLEVYEQGDYVQDIEQLEPLLLSSFRANKWKKYETNLSLNKRDMKSVVSSALKMIYNAYLTRYQYLWWPKETSEVCDVEEDIEIVTRGALNDIMYPGEEETVKVVLGHLKHAHEFLLHLFITDDKVKHEADTWNSVRHLVAKPDDEDEKDNERLAVSSIKEKRYPVGRKKVTVLIILEQLANSVFYAHKDEDDGLKFVLFKSIEVMLNYDIIMPLLQDYGVDYMVESYGSLLELISGNAEIVDEVLQNMLTLELLYNLLLTYRTQLRENPSHFYTLFLSMVNEDLSLTSRASLRLYRRVMHEVDIRNNLHLITMLSKTADTSLLSADAKRYLQSTSDKYAAAECISNASYILSHNRNNLVKLWELTGEFISAQKLTGRIVCVCPQRQHGCFLALVETTSEVGQKFASVWRIDRLNHKKLADIGSRTILSAWFDKTGEKLIVVEQNSADELRVIVCIPQTMEVKLEDNAISIVPHQQSSFMDKSLGIPHRVNTKLLGIMKNHLTGGKEDADPTELSFFKPTASGDGADLDTIVSTKPLIFSSLQTLWNDMLDKFDAEDEIVCPMREIHSDILQTKESLHKMTVTLHGMTTAGDIVVDCQSSDGTHNVLLYKFSGDVIKLQSELAMDEQATMTLMPTDDFVYSDTGTNAGLTSWNLPANDKKVFGNEHKHVTCLQFEVEEGQILSFTRGQVTVWNAVQKTTESDFTLDKTADVVAACLQDNWLAISNREGELTLRFEIRKKMASYHFHEPIDWIDCHVIEDHLYVACHINGSKPSICFLKYRVSDAPLHEPGKYVVRHSILA